METRKVSALAPVALLVGSVGLFKSVDADFRASDPGVRGGIAAGAPLSGLTASQLALFQAGKDEFEEVEGVGEGLGPRFNLDSCVGCHSQPATGGTSPAINPQIAVATAFGAQNTVPPFLQLNGPVREARFKKKPDGSLDGMVHSLFVISGRIDNSGDASGCATQQEDFAAQMNNGNLVFRIPSPMFGAGLIEQIPDSAILANLAANASQKTALGIKGKPSRLGVSGAVNANGNDGTIARFGWKAQNKSLLLFSGEAYNVEMGITSELFQTERDETPSCQLAQLPNTVTDSVDDEGASMPSAIEKFALFMRFLAPPTPSATIPGGASSIANGRALFQSVGCALCHTPTLTTGDARVAALRNQPVNLFSDLLLHNMGPELADDISQGQASGNEFRTAPLWGLGQRIFFLHDGRTSDLLQTIQLHKSGPSGGPKRSEASAVVDNFNGLSELHKQDILNFLRSL